MKNHTIFLSITVGLCVQAQGAITAGTIIGIDFESPSPVFGTGGVGTNASTNFNTFDVQAADGTTASFAGTETSIYSDSYGAANVVSMNRADFGTLTDASNVVIRFTSLQIQVVSCQLL